MKAAIWSALLLGVVSANNYNGHRVYRVDHASFLRKSSKLAKIPYTTWNSASEWEHEGHVDMVIKPEDVRNFERVGLKYDVMHKDLGESIEEEGRFADYATTGVDDSYFKSYHPYEDHLQFLSDLQAKFPDNSEVVTSGTSVEGREITGIHLWGSAGKGKKPAIVFHGQVHAREWIGGMTVEYIAYQLLTKYGSDADIESYLDSYDWHIFPVVNPDGFKYTQTNERLWRKNRQKTGSCYGTDINRNWPAGWSIPGGSSTNPCDETYRGPAASSAPETKGLSSYMSNLSNSTGLQMYIDFHSYSQLWMTPYGYSCSKRPANTKEQEALAADAGAAIKAVHGTSYETGPICSTIYQTSGSSVDWATDSAGAKYSFAVELRDTGRYGFVLPARFITPTAEETFAGLEAVLKGF